MGGVYFLFLLVVTDNCSAKGFVFELHVMGVIKAVQSVTFHS